MQLDNVVYSDGDTVHFQGYILENNLPATTSKNLYVDWFDSGDSLLSHQVYPIVNGIIAGQWKVPHYYQGGSFKVVAYTQALLLADSDRAFHSEIPLLGRKTKKSPLLQLFPEGGSLVAGISNRVGFHMEGIPYTEIYLISSLGDTISYPFANGKKYGSFSFVPEQGVSYRIILPILDMENIKLPPVREQGISMETIPYSSTVAVKLHKTRGFAADSLTLRGIMYGTVAFKSSFNLNGGDSIYVKIKTGSLPKGEMKLILTNSAGEALASRSVYISGTTLNENVPLQILDKTESNATNKNCRIILEDSVSATMSVSVRDVAFREKNNNMKSWLLLGREISDSLLDRNDLIAMEEVDDIMRCTRFAPFIQDKNSDTSYFCLSGHVRSKRKLPPDINLIVKNEGRYEPIKLSLDKDGHFRDSSFVIFDSCYIILAKGQEGFVLEADTLHPAAFSWYPFSERRIVKTLEKRKMDNERTQEAASLPVTLPSGLTAYEGTGSSNQLAAVTVHSKKWKTYADSVRNIYMSESMQSRYVNGFVGYDINFANNPSMFLAGTSLWDLLSDRIPYSPANKKLPANNAFLDEMPIDVYSVKDLQLPQIAFVRFIPRPNSTILIYTKKYTASTEKEHIPNDREKFLVGYTSYLPFGQTSSPEDKNVPDHRKTLFWQAGVVFDKNSPSFDIRFDNNSIAKKLLIVVEGIKADGTPIYYERIVDK